MRYKNLTILSGVITALALAQGPAQAIDVFGNNVGVNAKVGGGGNTNVGAGIGSTNATVSAGTGGASTAGVNANVSNGSSSALPDSLSANANIDLDSVTDGGRVTVDLNGDGVIDDDDTAMAKLDINGDGVLNVLDDANGDGVLNDADLDAAVNIGRNAASGVVDLGLGSGTGGVGSFSIGGLPVGDVDLGDLDAPQLPSVDIGSIGTGGIGDIGIGPGPGETPPPGIIPNPGVNPGPVPEITERDLSDSLRNLNDDDVAALKIKCADVMANPNAFSAATVSICKALASL